MQGIDFLRLSKSGEGDACLSPHDRVIVIGGGNTAIDSCLLCPEMDDEIGKRDAGGDPLLPS